MTGTSVRPLPPAHLHGAEAMLAAPAFEPARELREWMLETFVFDGAELHNPDHVHLAAARLEVLWTNVPATRHGRRILGQCEFRPPTGTMGKWARARAEAQLYGWFGQAPDFLLTFDAEYAARATDAEFCALVEHELYHCGQALDEFGMPKFNQAGMPAFTLRGHDIEEFVGVVRRYGVVSQDVAALVEAGRDEPEITLARVRAACGTCA